MTTTMGNAGRMTHAPGPWTYFVGNADGRGLIRIEADANSPEAGQHIASMSRGAVSEANARLIASGPDLLAALKDAEVGIEQLCVGQDHANECWNTLRTIRAAIARATGE